VKLSGIDIDKVIPINRAALPQSKYREDGFKTRQVFDIHICRKVTEYQAQVLVNEKGQRFMAPFPEGVTKAVQYGKTVKAHAVYMSQYQLYLTLEYKNILSTNYRSPLVKALLLILIKSPMAYSLSLVSSQKNISLFQHV
tara:strand:- start:13 stop:432 length:420 start_codon:yes stop_codon:yes gene_type:complete